MNAAQGAARAAGVQLLIAGASSVHDLDGAFKALATVDAVLISADALYFWAPKSLYGQIAQQFPLSIPFAIAWPREGS
jgi:ABC-type uncharacterized transport system substrate-binding protein